MRTGIARWIAVVAVLAGLVGAGPVRAKPTAHVPTQATRVEPVLLTRLEFRDLMIRRLGEQSPPIKAVAVSEEELVLTREGVDDYRMFLGNAYRMYLNDPEALEQTLGKFIRLAVGADREGELSAASLRALVRSPDFLSAAREMMARDGKPFTADDQPLSRVLAGDLVVLVAQDHPESYSYPPRKSVLEVVPGEGEVWKRALANTRAELGEIQTEELEDRLVIVRTSTGMALALLLLDEPWSRPDLKGKGAPVVLVVDRETLVVAHEDDIGAMATMVALARGMAADRDSGLLSAYLYVKRARGWDVLK
jgi:hypothetical protein